jgi:cyanophycin synthetase
MVSGISQVDAERLHKVIPSEAEAIDFAISNAEKGSFITICSDVVPDALQAIMKYKEAEDKFSIRKEDIPK